MTASIHAEVTQKRWGSMRTVFGSRSVSRTSRRLKESDISKWFKEASTNLSFRHHVQVSKVVTEVKHRQKGDRTIQLCNRLHVVHTAGEEDTAAALVGDTLQLYKIMLGGMQAAFCFPIPLEGDGGPPGSDGMHVPCDGLTALMLGIGG